MVQLTGRVILNLLGRGEGDEGGDAAAAAAAAEDDGIAGVYVPPLLITMLGTYLFYMAVGIWLMRYELIRMRLRSLRRKQAAAHSFIEEATDLTMWDDRSVAIWGSYGAAVLAMIVALIGARWLLSGARRELHDLQEGTGISETLPRRQSAALGQPWCHPRRRGRAADRAFSARSA